jgi:hypothetical protein
VVLVVGLQGMQEWQIEQAVAGLLVYIITLLALATE